MILKKYSALTQIENSLSLNERKIFNYLQYIKQTQNYSTTYYTSIKDIKRFLNTKYNNKSIIEALEGLKQKYIKINLFNKDKNIENDCIEILSFLRRNEDFSISFKFSEDIENLTPLQNSYSKVDLSIINSFNSKYSIAIYEFINDYKNVSTPANISIDTLQSLVGSKYKNFNHIKKQVLEVSKSEISDKTIFDIWFSAKKIAKSNKFINFTFHNYSKDTEFKYFYSFMKKNHLNKKCVIDNKHLAVSNNLSGGEWKFLLKNLDKISFFEVYKYENFKRDKE